MKYIQNCIPNLVVLCGLPGAGKSYYARKISEKNDFVICSSDTIREELFGDVNNQDNNEKVFKVLHQRVKENLRNGKNVIYDACNINSKRRRAFLNELKRIPCEKDCIVVATPYTECQFNNFSRKNRIVPTKVITSMYENWNTPYFFEGWDNIYVMCKTDTKIFNPYEWIEEHMDYNQNNHHHSMTLGEHCIATAYDLIENSLLYYAGLLHDCGKPFTKSFRNSKGEMTEDAHFYHHHCVGAYDSLFFEYPNNVKELDVSILINLHMFPYFWEKDGTNGEKTRSKYQKLWGEELYQNVIKLHEADKNAH